MIRFAGRSTNPIVHTATLPGLWLQKITTNPPADEMVEVAIQSLLAVLPPEERARMGWPDQPQETDHADNAAVAAACGAAAAAEDTAARAACDAEPVLEGKN